MLKLAEAMANSPGAISLTLDAWTSPMQNSRLGVTAHWIKDDWKLVDVVLAVKDLKGPHSGENLARALEFCLDQFSTRLEVQSMMTNNASNNGTMAEELVPNLPMFDEHQHIPCSEHIFNPAVQAGFKELDVKEALGEDEALQLADDVLAEVQGGWV